MTSLETIPSPLIDGARTGAQPAIEALIAAVWPQAFRIALSVTGNGTLAEDAAQEACAVLFQAVAKLRSTDAFGAWFYRIVVRQAVAVSRKNASFSAEVEAYSKDEDATIDRVDMLRALAALGTAQRTAVVLHYYGSMNSREIADVLGIPDSTVRFHIMRAKQALTKLLAAPAAETLREEVCGGAA